MAVAHGMWFLLSCCLSRYGEVIPLDQHLVENSLGELLNILLEVNQEGVGQPICD